MMIEKNIAILNNTCKVYYNNGVKSNGKDKLKLQELNEEDHNCIRNL